MLEKNLFNSPLTSRITGNDVFEGHSTFTVVQYMWQSKDSN